MRKILMAALAACLFWSCNKEADNADSQNGGKNATIDIVMNFPETAQSKAADSNSSTQDSKIDAITVFIFNADGTHADGSPATLGLADFDNVGTNKYSLKETSRITTKSGSKHIYVGINLSAALAGVANEDLLISEASAANLTTATNVAMLSAGQTERLSAQEVGATPTVNKINVNIERLVSKIAVTAGANSSYTLGTTQTYTIAPDKFSVGNVATHFYPVQRVKNSKLVTPLKRSTTPAALKTLNAKATAANALTSVFYVPENTTTALLRGEGTYAVVRGTLNFTHFASVNSSTGNIEYTAAGTPTGDIWVVRKGATVYFCNTEAKANDVINKIGLSNKYKYVEAAGKYYTFYYVFINIDNATDPMALYRNQFRNITINSVKGIGVPGDPTNPTDPTDPIVDPDDPAKETAAYLEISVDVKAWDYLAVATDLE